MIHQAPAGARDLLPLEVVQKAWINDRLQASFQRWGYQRVVTSTLEWVETLTAGGAIDPNTVIQLQNTTEGQLGLRPELTASIARTAVTRMADSTYPQRLCYRANVFRQPLAGHHGRQLEFYQAGVELLFAGGQLADAEILLLLADCLKQLGIPQWKLILGEAGLTQALLSPFPEPLKQEVRTCLANLDYVSLTNLTYPSDDLRERAMTIFDLRGTPDEVLSKVLTLELSEEIKEKVNNLKTLLTTIAENNPNFPLILDLSLVQTFDYYTGIVFKVLSQGEHQLFTLGQGGRYDQLLGIYHPQNLSASGIGFSFNIEDLHSRLLETEILPQVSPAMDWLVIPCTPQSFASAFNYAEQLRQSDGTLRVEMELGARSPQEIRDYAKNRRIKSLAWIDATEEPKLETISPN
ncbi:MAG: ATP phosphoribosyltransferase regulatory subunit [Microcystaceae cyanobacterium]